MKLKRLSILFLIMLVCALTVLTSCGIDSSSLSASASIPMESETEVTEQPLGDVSVENEQAQVIDIDGEDEEAIDVQEEEMQPEEEAEATDEEMVWLSKTGKCYHSKSTCSNMKDPVQVPLSEALKKKKKACSKCYD